MFERLLPPDVPAGSTFVVEGLLREEPRRSESFEMDSGSGMALVLARGGGW